MIRVYRFKNGVPVTVAKVGDTSAAVNMVMHPERYGLEKADYYYGPIVERHQALG